MPNATGNFTSGSIDKYLFSLAMPAFVTILVGLSFVTVDTYFLSRLGKGPLTAISFIFPVVSAFQMVGVGLGIAASSVLSRLIGAGKAEAVSIHIVTLIAIAILLSVFSVPLLDFSLAHIFHAMAAGPATMPYILQFMHVWLAGLLFILTGYMGSNILRSHGKAKLSANMQISSSLINLALSPLFIFSFHWGMAGCALAGVLARLLMILIMYYYIFKHYIPNLKRSIHEAIASFWQHARQLGAIAVPAILTNVIGPLSSLWMVHLLAKTGGGDIVAGFGIASRVEMLAVIPLYALSASVGPIIGQNMGANIYQRCYDTLIKSYKVSLIWGVFIAIILAVVGRFVAEIFTDSALVIHVTSIYLSILPLSYASWGVIMMTNANFNSMGKPVISTLITTVRLVIVFIPLSYLLSIKYHYMGVFFAFALSNIITSLWAARIGIKQWRNMNEHIAHMPTTAIASAGN